VLRRPRALVTTGVACLAVRAVAGNRQTRKNLTRSTATATGNSLSIYISDPPDVQHDPAAQDVVDAAKLAFTAQRREVSDYGLNLYMLKNKPSDNARAAIIDKTTIAYLGEIAPGTSDQTVGITNALDVLQVSPTDTAMELSQRTPAVPNAPKTYFESYGTYGRTFARVVPNSSVEAGAQVAEMKALGVSNLYVTDDGSDYGRAIADAVSTDARTAGITLTQSLSGAGAVFDGAAAPEEAAHLFEHAAAQAPGVKLFGPSSLNSAAFTSAIAPSIRNVYVSIPGFLPRDLPAAGRSFVTAFKATFGHDPNTEAIFGYEAMSALLRVLKQEGTHANNRAAVATAFLGQHNVSSALGTYSIDSGGDTNLHAFVFARLQGGRLVPFKAAPVS